MKDVTASYDILVELFERIQFFLYRLNCYTNVQLTTGMVELLGKIMAQVIKVLALSTKAMKERRISESTNLIYCSFTDYGKEQLLKKLAGRRDVENALQRLDTLTKEEGLMAAARNLEVTHRVDDNVATIKEAIHDIDSNVKMMKDLTSEVDGDVKAIKELTRGVDGNVMAIKEVIHDVNSDIKEAKELAYNFNSNVTTIKGAIQGVDGNVEVIKELTSEIDGNVKTVKELTNNIDGNVTTIRDVVQDVDSNSRVTKELTYQVGDDAKVIKGIARNIDDNVKATKHGTPSVLLCNEGRRAGLGNGPNASTAAHAVASPGMDTLPFVDFPF